MTEMKMGNAQGKVRPQENAGVKLRNLGFYIPGVYLGGFNNEGNDDWYVVRRVV